MKVENLSALIAKLERAKVQGPLQAGIAARLSAEHLLSESMAVTPKDEGWLRDSGSVQPQAGVTMTTGGFFVTVGYNTEYAWAVHEMPDSNQWTTPGTGPKFLEGPFASNKAMYTKAIFDGVRKGIKFG